MFLLQASDISIEHRWQVSMMCTLSRIVQDIDGPLHSLLPGSQVVIRETRLIIIIIMMIYSCNEIISNLDLYLIPKVRAFIILRILV